MPDTIAANAEHDDVADVVIDALKAALPTVAIRRAAHDEIAIEDEAGCDWILILCQPREP